MARTPASGQAAIDLIIGTLFAMTLLAILMNLASATEQSLKGRRFRDQGEMKWIDNRSSPQ